MTRARSTSNTRNFSAVALRLFLHLRRHQTNDATELLRGQLALLTAEQVYLNIVLPAVGLAATKSALGEIATHEAREIFNSFNGLLDICRSALHRQPPLGLRMHAVSLPGELHGAGLRVICDWLWRDGWDTHLHVCEAGEDDLAKTLLTTPSQMLAISCSAPRQAVIARRLIRLLRRGGFAGSIWIGGMAINAFPSLFERSGADHTAPDIVRFTRELATEFGYSTATPPYL